MNVPTIAVASTGITATLLPGGKTAHSQFQLPIPTLPGTTSQIKLNFAEGNLMRYTHVIWDEAPMIAKHVFEAVDIML